jgi:hypothetical protein
VSFIYRSNLDLKIDALVSRSEHTPFWCRCRGSRVSDGRVITWRSWIKPLGAAAALAGVLYSEPHLLQQIWIPWRSLSSPKHPSFIPVKKNPSFILLAPDPWRSSISASAIRFYPPHPQYNSATKHSRSSVPRRPDVLLSSPALFCLSSGFSFSAVVPRCSRCYSTMFSHSFFPIEVIIVYSTHCSNCCSACAVRVIEGRAHDADNPIKSSRDCWLLPGLKDQPSAMHGITEKELYVPWALGIICRHDPCVRGGHLFYLLLGFKKKTYRKSGRVCWNKTPYQAAYLRPH